MKKDTSYLVAGDKTGKTKLDQAKKYGAKVITEEGDGPPGEGRNAARIAYSEPHACASHPRRGAVSHRRHRHADEPQELEAAPAHHRDAHLTDRAGPGKPARRDQGTRRAERAGHRADAVQRPPRRVDARDGAGAPLVGSEQLLAHAAHRDRRPRLHGGRRLGTARARDAGRRERASSTSRTSRRAARSTTRSRTSRRSSRRAA